jgi:phosphoglucomutase
VGITKFGSFEVEVIDPVADYKAALAEVFDFDMLKK